MERTTFFNRLRQNRLLSEAELEQAARRFGDTDPTQEIADALVKDGMLTPFQIRQMYAGDTQLLTLGQYRLLDELGRGGMGHVYKALHTIMGRVVAIKVISPELVQNPVAVEWFRREVRASTHLVHPNIVMAYDANEADGWHFLVMEYVEGVTLDALVKQHGPLPVDHVCALMRQTALGLQYAHEKGMVHRDVKPANLLIPHVGSEQACAVLVKIVDFGLARLHDKADGDTLALGGEVGLVGTPDYISPEQSRDIHSADIRSDLYSLGCTFYYALAGRPPFLGENVMEKLIKHLMEEPTRLEAVRPNVPSAVAAIIRRLMAKNPADRHQTPVELVRELDALQAESSKGIAAASAPCPAPGNGAAACEQPTSTRVLAHIEPFAPQQQVEPSGPSLLEPLWKYAPSEIRQSEETHDTLPPLQAGETKRATMREKESMPGAKVDSDSTLEEVRTSVAALVGPAAGSSGTTRSLDATLRRHWRRWTALLEIIVEGSGYSRVNSDTYRTVYTALLHVCRGAVESAVTPERRLFYQELVSIVEPWLSLKTFAHTEASMLEALLRRCRQAERELNDGKAPWTVRQSIGLMLLLLSSIGLVLWYWKAGRLWLPSLMETLQWRHPLTSLRYAWNCVEAHPSLIMGGLFLAAFFLSIHLLSGKRRILR